jgi:hypothetical protein
MHRACTAAYAMARTRKQALKRKRPVSIKVSEQFSPDALTPHGDHLSLIFCRIFDVA